MLGPAFFARPAGVVARDLLGRVLVRERAGQALRCPILETEAYHGTGDRASHAHRGRTPRNAPMFGAAGVWYVYLVYGLHWMLNLVTGDEGEPSAVLLRAAGDADRPGVLTRRLGVDGTWSGRPAGPSSGLWIEEGEPVDPRSVVRLPRVGVDYAGAHWKARRLRFLVRPTHDAPPRC